MSQYSPSVHTPEALGAEIRDIQSNMPSSFLVGSIGRSVIFGQILGNPHCEFSYRGQAPTHAGNSPRDIDLAGAGRIETASYQPFGVDTSGYSGPFLDFVREGDAWFVVADYHGFAEALHPDVMAPVEGSAVYGIEATTLPAKTLAALYGVKGGMRKKDITSQNLLDEACDQLDPSQKFPDKMLEPLRRLERMNSQTLYVRSQNLYRRVVPENVRRRVVPLMRVAKELYLH